MFRLRWTRQALDQLAAAWVGANADYRRLITLASADVELRLAAQPFTQGESRPAGRRILVVAPLAVTFRVDADKSEVTVLHVRFYQRRQTPP
jgi:hypothetical protein